MRVRSRQALEFACHSSACRPPTAGGTGGSSSGGKKALDPDKDIFPDTMTWKATKVPGQDQVYHGGGGYTITKIGYDQISTAFLVRHNGQDIGRDSKLRTAKTRAEMHKAGVELPIFVSFFNVPKS